MSRGHDISTMLKPLADCAIQAYFGTGLHTLGLLGWILQQTGRANVFVSSYSTSEPFLNGVVRLRDRKAIKQGVLLLDQRAARKTVQLEQLMQGAFDHVFLGENHSKVMIVRSKSMCVAVVTSQNQTYGSRAESSVITTDKTVCDQLLEQFVYQCSHAAAEIDISNGTGIITQDRRAGTSAADTAADWQPFGVEW